MIGSLAQSIRQLVEAAMGMPANSVRPADQIVGSGRDTEHLATVQILRVNELGWPSLEYANVDGTKTSPVNENVDQLLELVASVNFFRGGNADAAGLPSYTVQAVDDAARLPQRLRMAASLELAQSLGVSFVGAGSPRDLTGLAGAIWRSRGQIELRFYAVNRETSQINSIGSGSITTTIRGPGAPVTSTEVITT